MFALQVLFGETDKGKLNWPTVQKMLEGNPMLMMGNGTLEFIVRFHEFDWKDTSHETLNLLEPFLAHHDFNKETVMAKSEVVGRICSYIINTVKAHKIWSHVQTYCPEDGSALIASPVADPQLEGGNIVQSASTSKAENIEESKE